jgi:hypothetical protein
MVSAPALLGLPLWLVVNDLVPRTTIIGLLACYIGAAFAVGFTGVVSQRRGVAWWIRTGSTPGRVTARPLRLGVRRPFRSSAAAQFWYEWGCHGWNLPGFVGVVLMLIGGMTMIVRHRADSIVDPVILGTFLGIPVIFAAALGTGLGRLRPFWINSWGFITFIAVRPMTSGALVTAKFRMAMASVLLTWAITLVLTSVWFVASGDVFRVSEWVTVFLRTHSGGQGVAILGLGAILLPALTWKYLTGGVAAVITGRRWLVDGATYLFLGLLFGLTAAGVRLAEHPEDRARLFSAIPWLVAAAAVIKGTIAIVTIRSALRRQLIDWPTLWRVLSLWLAFTACAGGLTILVLPDVTVPVSKPVILLGVAAFMPLVRYPLSTLALEWNRHR